MNDDTLTARSPGATTISTDDATDATAAGADRGRRIRRRPARMTPARLRAQRANARLSTGPRTLDGSRRAALNRLRFPLDPSNRRHMKRHGQDSGELQRIWRELAAIFWFLDPTERYFGLYLAAWRWWRKLNALRAGPATGGFRADLAELNSDVDACLALLISRHARATHDWERPILKALGKDALNSTQALRAAVEARLDEFRDASSPIPRRSLLKKNVGVLALGQAFATQPTPWEILVAQGRRYLAAIQGIEPGDPALASRLTSLAFEERMQGRMKEIDQWLAPNTLSERRKIGFKMGPHPLTLPGGRIRKKVVHVTEY